MDSPALGTILLTVLLTNLIGLLLVNGAAVGQYNGYNPSINSQYNNGQNRYDDGRGGGYNYANSQPNIYGTYSTGYYNNNPSSAYGYDTRSGYYNSGYNSYTPGQFGNTNYGNSQSYYNGNNNNNNFDNNRYGYSSSSYYPNNGRPWDSYNNRNSPYYSSVYTTTPYYDRSSGYYNDRYNAAPGPIVRIKAIPQTAWSVASMIKVGAVALAVIMGQVALAGFFM